MGSHGPLSAVFASELLEFLAGVGEASNMVPSDGDISRHPLSFPNTPLLRPNVVAVS